MPFLPSDPAVQTALLVGLAVVVLGLVVYGFRDLKRFSLTRAWAVGGVAFREGVRRRVLWVTPLAMLAVLALVYLADPTGEREAIRQAARSALFACGLVAIVVPLILSCTSLPREVDNKVIFTVVTKPLSRLELLLGKLMGFARLSGVVLLIMGVFSYLVIAAMSWSLGRDLDSRLAGALPNENRRTYLQHLADDGLMRADRLDLGEDLQVYAIAPGDEGADDADDAVRWYPPLQYYAAVPFTMDAATAADLGERAAAGTATVQFLLRNPWQLRPGQIIPTGWYPPGIANLDNLPPVEPPGVELQLLSGDLFNLIGRNQIPANRTLFLPADPRDPTVVTLTPEQSRRLAEEWLVGPVYAAVWGISVDYFYGATSDCVGARIVDTEGNVLLSLEPDLSANNATSPRNAILLRTYVGVDGLGFSGPEDVLDAPIGVLAYRDTPAPPTTDDGRIGFELVGNVGRTGGVLDEGDTTRVRVSVRNANTGFVSEPQTLLPETNAPVYFTVPAEAVEGGDFDLRLQTESRGHVFSLNAANVRLVVGGEPYWLNLAKALLGLWLLSLLVAVCGLTFSTFVSWPIAVVLTVAVLGGRWVADQLGTAFDGSLGRGVVTQYFDTDTDAATAKVVETGFDALGGAFSTITRFLPPIGTYDFAPPLERGLAVPWGRLAESTLLTLAFGLPLLSVGYVVLRNKEVAP